MLASSPGSLCVSHWRAWYFFSRNLTEIIVHGQDRLKDCCTSLPYAAECISAQSVVQTGSGKKPQEVHVQIQTCTLLPSFYPTCHTREKKYHAGPQLAKVKCAGGPGKEATFM